MSAIGRPPGNITFSPTPPERGSFPLDHDGECKPVMMEYLACLKRVKGVNEHECRMLAKKYLRCRMERSLMAPDEMKNLGFHDDEEVRTKKMSRLDELRRENEELKKRDAGAGQ
ncbi:hypothetical protein BDZ91DRAFT_690486 [Kalaharituber pfeilii]|nr:hypothetical protein BDZ91DRAFT_690486 [Kalaharituber pfeilii]